MNPSHEAATAYEILGVPRSADLPAIRRAFRALALMHHPDARPPEEKDDAARFFARINRAHEVLRDPEKKRAYDARLDRGETVDLDQDVGAPAAFARLAQILGQVKSFGLPDDSETLLGALGEETRDTFLKPMLVSGNGFAETVADVLPVQFSEADPWLEPLSAKRREALGALARAFLVVTNLRLILVAAYSREALRGQTAVVKTSLRARGIPYEAIRELTFGELGRVSRTYRLEVRTDEGRVGVQINLGPRGNALEQHMAFMSSISEAEQGEYPASRLSRILLIAHAHGLPLRVVPGDAPDGEYGAAALGAGCVPVLVWAIPFVAATVCGRCAGERSVGCFNHWPAIARFMDEYWITPIAAIAVPVLIARRWIEIFRAGLRRPAEILAQPEVKR